MTEQTSAQSCSDCTLGMLQAELNSPLGYDEDLANDFASATSRCSKTGYPFTSPTPYALNASATTSTSTGIETSATATATCSDTYTVAAGDTCVSIAIAHNVSTFYLAYDNNLDIYCSGLSFGSTLCLPEICDVYTVQPNDTCISIIRAVPEDITVTQLQTWNPNINLLCGNMDNFKGTIICVR
jgi:LysM repeat protein